MQHHFLNAIAVRNKVFGHEDNDTTFIIITKGSKNPELTQDASEVFLKKSPIAMRLLNAEDVSDCELLMDKLDLSLKFTVV